MNASPNWHMYSGIVLIIPLSKFCKERDSDTITTVLHRRTEHNNRVPLDSRQIFQEFLLRQRGMFQSLCQLGFELQPERSKQSVSNRYKQAKPRSHSTQIQDVVEHGNRVTLSKAFLLTAIFDDSLDSFLWVWSSARRVAQVLASVRTSAGRSAKRASSRPMITHKH